MINYIISVFDKLNHAYGVWIDKIDHLDRPSSFIIMLAMYCSGWAFAWNAHVIAIWFAHIFDLNPGQVDSVAKIEWRRIWSSVICLSGIILTCYVYLRNRRHRKRGE